VSLRTQGGRPSSGGSKLRVCGELGVGGRAQSDNKFLVVFGSGVR
jgi:hypothetical protein